MLPKRYARNKSVVTWREREGGGGSGAREKKCHFGKSGELGGKTGNDVWGGVGMFFATPALRNKHET